MIHVMPIEAELSQLTARDRMLFGAIEVIRERGLHAASFSELIERSGAPRGSIYHHFPGGKEQLATEAIELAGRLVTGHLQEAAARSGSAGVIKMLFRSSNRLLQRTNYRHGCPVGAVAVEAASDTPLGRTARGAFDEWASVLDASLRAEGHAAGGARELALLAVSSLEGAILVSRARGDSQAISVAEAHLLGLVTQPQ
jgi:AcrR family transcriptional regulator